MSPIRRTGRRGFLKGSVAGLAALAAPRAFGASPNLKLKKPIKIGCQTILSGPLGGYGEFMRKGAVLAMEEINAQGGIGGSPIELNFRDEELKVDVGVKNARYFVDDWGADFLVGIDSSAVALAVGEIMPSLNRVLIVTHGATEKFNEDLVFKRRVRAGGEGPPGEALGDHLARLRVRAHLLEDVPRLLEAVQAGRGVRGRELR